MSAYNRPGAWRPPAEPPEKLKNMNMMTSRWWYQISGNYCNWQDLPFGHHRFPLLGSVDTLFASRLCRDMDFPVLPRCYRSGVNRRKNWVGTILAKQIFGNKRSRQQKRRERNHYRCTSFSYMASIGGISQSRVFLGYCRRLLFTVFSF